MRATVTYIRNTWHDFLSAMQFLTRIPVPTPPYTADSLARAVVFFPIVGLIVGSIAAVVHVVLASHLSRLVTAFLVITILVLLTGCFHEDALADTSDGFGGGWNRDHILVILKDSRIGSYGGAALVISLVGRMLLIASLPLGQVPQYLIAAHVLCRWTTLPLSHYQPAARDENEARVPSQGVRIAKLISLASLILGSVLSFSIAAFLLQWRAFVAIPAVIFIALLSGLYYKRRIGGVTGDCFGATNQIAEIAVYVVGAWVR